MPLYGFDTTQLLGLLLTVVLPVVVAVVTKESWASGLKSTLLAGLTALTAVLTEAVASGVNHVSFGWRPVVLQALVGWAIAVATHYGLWKPSGIAASLAKTGVSDGSDYDSAGSSLPPSASVPVTPPVPGVATGAGPVAVPPSTGPTSP